MEPVMIFVRDSYHTEAIVEVLNHHFGSKVLCSTNFNDTEKFDIFFLSGKHILDHIVDPVNIKQKFGIKNAKIVAVSVSESYLREIEAVCSLGVDFTLNKELFFDAAIKTIQKKPLSSTLTDQLDAIFNSVQQE